MTTVKNAKKKTKKKSPSSRPRLDSPSNPSSLRHRPKAAAGAAGPLELPLDLIDEDPNQPRKGDNPGFSEVSLKELARTIQDRGVKSPISVREHRQVQGRYIINHGARRYRASRIAGKKSIPAFIDNDYSEADQIIENLQRNELTPREIADFIGRELAKGKKKQAIAGEIGKSPAFVTQHVTLLDLPDPIAKVFSTGRANDVTVINELVTAYKKNPEEVGAWLADDNLELTRRSVKLLREFLQDKRWHEGEEYDFSTAAALADGADAAQLVQGQPNERIRRQKKETDPQRLKKAVIRVDHRGRPARLILDKRPSAEGWAWLTYEDDGVEFEADLRQVRLVALIDG